MSIMSYNSTVKLHVYTWPNFVIIYPADLPTLEVTKSSIKCQIISKHNIDYKIAHAWISVFDD